VLRDPDEVDLEDIEDILVVRSTPVAWHTTI
jgi:hypothetical protein